MRSFTRKEKKMRFLMLFLGNMKMEGSLFSLSFIVQDWLQAMHQEWINDPKISHLIQQLQANSQVSPGYSWHNDEICYKGNLYLIKQSQLKSTMLSELHATPIVGHLGFTKTYDRVKCSFFWDGMKKGIHTFVVECDVFQRNKGETIKTLVTLQPLSIPPTIWRDILTQAHALKHVLSQDLLFSRGPKNSNVLLFPYREIFTHRTLVGSPSLQIGRSDFMTSRIQRSVVERWFHESPTPDISQC
jgi:hypothetical protein